MTENQSEPEVESFEEPQAGFFTCFFRTIAAIVILGVAKSPVLYFVWNWSAPFLSSGRLHVMEFWQAMLILIAYDVLSYFSFRNLVDEGPQVISIPHPVLVNPSDSE